VVLDDCVPNTMKYISWIKGHLFVLNLSDTESGCMCVGVKNGFSDLTKVQIGRDQ